MTKHERWARNARANNNVPTKDFVFPKDGNPGIIQGITSHNHTPKLPSMQAWTRATSEESKRPSKAIITKGKG